MAKWLSGFHAVEESLKSGVSQATLYLTGKGARFDKLIRLAQKKGVPFRSVNKQKLQALTGMKDARDCAIQIFKESTVSDFQKDNSTTLEEFLEKLESRSQEKATVLILDCITDPHNLGAILRSADQFAVDCVIIPQRGSAKQTSTVMKTSAGAARYVKSFTVANLKRSIDLLKEYGFWVYGTDMAGKTPREEPLADRCVIVMGSEGKGMRQLTANSCDSVLTIPTAGHIDSLNVSVACGIILYEVHTGRLVRS